MKRMYKKRKAHISNWSLYRKILVSMLGCTLLAMILSSVIVYGRTAEEMVELNERYLRQNVKRTTEQIERVVSGALIESFACLHQTDNRELILNKDLRFEDASSDEYNNLQFQENTSHSMLPQNPYAVLQNNSECPPLPPYKNSSPRTT